MWLGTADNMAMYLFKIMSAWSSQNGSATQEPLEANSMQTFLIQTMLTRKIVHLYPDQCINAAFKNWVQNMGNSSLFLSLENAPMQRSVRTYSHNARDWNLHVEVLLQCSLIQVAPMSLHYHILAIDWRETVYKKTLLSFYLQDGLSHDIPTLAH